MGERCNRTAEVRGSNPLGSTTPGWLSPRRLYPRRLSPRRLSPRRRHPRRRHLRAPIKRANQEFKGLGQGALSKSFIEHGSIEDSQGRCIQGFCIQGRIRASLLAEVYWQRLCKGPESQSGSLNGLQSPPTTTGLQSLKGSLCGRSRGSTRRRGTPCHFGRQIPTSSACGQRQSLHRVQEGQGFLAEPPTRPDHRANLASSSLHAFETPFA